MMSSHHRQMQSYPTPVRQAAYFVLTLTIGVSLAWSSQVAGAVAPQIMTRYEMSFRFYVAIAIVSIAVGAAGSSAAGLTDRFGRTSVICGGTFVIALLVLFAIPNATDKSTYLALTALAGLCHGAAGIAVVALVRDFSPQVHRATAMALWALCPVLGALVAHSVAAGTLDVNPDWRFQFQVCGVAVLVVASAAALFLRELSPALRNHVIVHRRDAKLAEMRIHALVDRPSWRSVLGLDVVASAVGISLYLMFYYTQVGFFVVYLLTNFGYTAAQANGLTNWYWAISAMAMLGAGALSDRLHVRKPLMLTGALTSVIASALVAICSTRAETAESIFVPVMILAAIGNGLVFPPWMAAHTETVERRNPAASATGMALWSIVNRTIVTIVLIAFAFAVTAPSVLVDHGTRVSQIAEAHPEVVQALTDGVSAPTDATISSSDLTYLGEHLRDVVAAKRHSPNQWQSWWWICAAGQLAFCMLIPLLSGRWSPRKARAELQAHAARIETTLRELRARSARV